MTERLTLPREDAERLREIEALAAAGDVPALLGRLVEPSWAVRRGVVAALAQLGAPAVPGLVHVLTSERGSETRLAAAVDALAAARADVETPLVALVHESAPAALLCDIAQVLGRRHAVASAEILIVLTRHADDNVAVAAMEALGRLGGPRSVEAMIELAGSPSFFRAFPSLAVLGRSGDARAVPALLEALASPLLAGEAVRALGQTGDLRAAAPLAARLAEADRDDVRSLAVALFELGSRRSSRRGDEVRHVVAAAAGPDAAAALVGALAGADAHERRALAALLAWLGGATAVAGLFALLSDADHEVAAQARGGLEQLGPDIDELLVRELHAGDAARRLVLLPLSGGRTRLHEATLACLGDDDPSVRVAACEALARGGDPRAVTRLFALLEDSDTRVGQAAQGAIQALGSADTERLALASAGSPLPAVRRAAFRIIGYFGYPSGLEPLLAGVGDPDPRLAETAIGALALLDDGSAREALLGAARDGTAKVRAAAVRALGQGHVDEPVRVALRVALADDDDWVRYYAIQALGRLHDRVSASVLIARLVDPAGQVRLAAVEALAQIDDPRALAALAAAIGSSDVDVRRAALVGLGQSRRSAALPLILQALTVDDASTRLVAVSALAALDDPEVARSLARLAGNDADANVRSAAFALLSSRAGTPATVALVGLAGHAELAERLAAALATPVEGRVNGLLAALSHADDVRAGVCARALVRLGRPDAEAALAQTLAAAPLPARRAAVEALAGLRSPLAREALHAASLTDPDPQLRAAAALALEA